MKKGPDIPSSDTVQLPELAWRRAHDLGEIQHVIRPPGEWPVASRTTIKVSERKSEPLIVLESGERLVVTKRKHCPVPADVDGVLLEAADDGTLSWLAHKRLEGQDDAKRWRALHRTVSASWREGIRYSVERIGQDGKVVPGLRPPQVGALHAIGAHWSLHRAPATVVMPTGTGKTETMVAALVGEMKGTLLVVVPSQSLRAQTTDKYRTLGLLRELGVVSDDVRNPIVGTLLRRPRSAAELSILDECHVVVATMASVGQGTAVPLVPRIARKINTLVVDEAHHIAARSWGAFRERFCDQRVLQFTATPFRRDGQLVDGEVIYSYPLRRAQEDKYFKPIRFDPVVEIDPDEGDKAIAQKALAQLSADRSAGLDHLVMARCENIERAQAVHGIYKSLAPDHSPVLVHSQEPASSERVRALFNRTSRIVVCVDMLGEGFDLPQLKIAAVHDTHKSLAVLLQFAGRFTRTAGDDVGDATVVANIADQDVSDALERLYSEDADWNYLLAEMSSQAIRDHKELVDFLNESVSLHEEGDEESLLSISPSLLRPKFSTAAYWAARFHPRRFHRALSKHTEVHRVWLHEDSQTLYFVTRTEPPVPWTRSKELRDRQWDLFVLHFNNDLEVLFIHSSDKSSLHEALAKAVTGAEPKLIRGDPVFRTLANISRLQFQNIGITKHGRRNLRYAMYTGADVKQALEASQTANSTKSNLSGSGFEHGVPVTVGCSYKGRVWTKENGPIRKFLDWCRDVGVKLVDESINTDDIIDNVMIPEEVDEFPNATVLSLEWPIELLKRQEDRVVLKSDSTEASLGLFELVFDAVSGDRKTLSFHIEGEGARSDFLFQLGVPSGFRVTHAGGDVVTIAMGRLERPLAELLDEWPPLVRFVDLSELDANLLIRPQEAPELVYPAERFEVWDWSGADVTKESLWKDGTERRDSIQAQAAQHFIEGGFDVVFDDDASGEAADLVCLKAEVDHIRMALVHCKFTKNTAGARVKDVVEVCSQAVRSGRWMWNFKGLCKHLTMRERRLASPGRSTRFLQGDVTALNKLVQRARFQEVRGEVVIVQPGLSESGHTPDQVAVLAAAHCFLNDTVAVGLDVICSA